VAERGIPDTELESESSDVRIARLEGALHDVANALTVVLGWLEVAEDQVLGGTLVARALRLAHERGQHGRTIALRTVRSNHEISEQPVACEYFIRDAVLGMEPQAKRKGVELAFDVPQDCCGLGVTFPCVALQIITNLLMNAVSFTPSGRRVVLETARGSDASFHFVVQDEGPGLDPDQIPRLFDGLDSTRQGGTGIGLRYSHRLAKDHGGRLSLIDPGPGAGFELRWPSVTMTESRMQTPCTLGLEGMRLLVVEDDSAVSMLLELALQARGSRVETVYDQESMEAHLRAARYDAALIDLSPLEPDVAGALRRIRSAHPHVKLILITGSAVAPDPAVSSLASAWVRKPFETRDIVAVLMDLLR
jgi:CheY-like chemotaxis protein